MVINLAIRRTDTLVAVLPGFTVAWWCCGGLGCCAHFTVNYLRPVTHRTQRILNANIEVEVAPVRFGGTLEQAELQIRPTNPESAAVPLMLYEDRLLGDRVHPLLALGGGGAVQGQAVLAWMF